MIGAVVEALAANRTRWRRARNLRAGTRGSRPVQLGAHRGWRMAWPSPLGWLTAACALLAIAGAVVIALHARWLAGAAGAAAEVDARLAAFQPVLPGVAFTVPEGAGIQVRTHGGTTLLILSGMQAEPAQRIDLCTQMLDPSRPGRLLALRAGWRFDDVAALAARNAVAANPVALRNIVLASDPMPRVLVSGWAAPDFRQPGARGLDLRWEGQAARWLGGGTPLAAAPNGEAALGTGGWLLWGDRALRIARHASRTCPTAGEIVFQLYRPAPSDTASARALVTALPAAGAPLETWLAPGDWRVPGAAPAAREDQQLFERLSARGLVRLDAGGLAELAPPDLAAWRAQDPKAWEGVAVDDEAKRLLEQLYRRADGAYVREQVRIFNGERRLLAWRTSAGRPLAARAEASGDAQRRDAMPVTVADDMPAAAARLFARLPQGWAPWRRVASWPAASSAARLRLQPDGAQAVRLMLAGRLLGVQGAQLRGAPAPACDGRACRRPDEVQVLDLVPEAGGREIVLDVAPLGMDALATPGDARYRHLAVKNGRLAWQALPIGAGTARPATADVALADRNGQPLWRDGVPTDAARDAGLATLLGVHAGQEGGVAGMLGRLRGARHEARLTLDLDLQRAAHDALDCIGLRGGRWDGKACGGAGAVPAGRQAGVVVLDTETGDILAAAGAGNGRVDAANWREARDFDRIDPAASPLRLPAWQHDGGAERSPGSTFKIVSALGLELAAKRDRELDALLDGLPLPAINGLAARRGYAFRTDAPVYPLDQGAKITNFRDQGLDRRAQDGRLGLAQALTYSLNTWFAWSGELSDRSLLGKPDGGVPDLQPLEPGSLDEVRPIVAMARRLGFGAALRLDGGLLPPDYRWSAWDALQASAAGIDPVHTRHELRQMAIGLRMQATPLQMALVAGAVGGGRAVVPRLLAELDGQAAAPRKGAALGVRLDRIRAGMKGVVDAGTASGAFRGADLEGVRRGLSGKTGTAPIGDGDLATVWFTGWLEPHSLPDQPHRLAVAVFVSRSEGTGGGHAAPVAASMLRWMAQRAHKGELTGK
ncbi:penicillin-binding transpeptidase domain-containing protein [Massilia sp. YIM B02763]|uniref:penicillin-binding transpeptidase domain-containing protein n=1 Tax=Massilia sp. YIM B02763 TaxID=3050130 RepID=UPI0025B6746B|nr:penicillin-binding transpeptidase domain-containing protein [Massilia sp. YIM B02763]MDN4056108.1 penicillin-binding transpeptidase domain-containing protein [Massilia sp. YIM B02763]